ncbi:hypothetical protein V7201_22765, partial [Bacillus sp. JJ1122]|uniref:hypothetical protein n=1 Tax=Bacillus sp. JJ1122 TaxID=3122951 RepID=UPI002FFD698A
MNKYIVDTIPVDNNTIPVTAKNIPVNLIITLTTGYHFPNIHSLKKQKKNSHYSCSFLPSCARRRP